MKIKIILCAFIFMFLGVGVLFLYRAQADKQGIMARHFALKTRKLAWADLEDKLRREIAGFNGTVGIVVRDLDTNWEISINKDILFPSASLVKIPIMLSYYYAAEDGKVNLGEPIRVKPRDIVSGSKVLGAQPSGSVFTVEQLMGPMITQSDNAAANILIDFMGFDTLNAYFQKMGLRHTNLARKMMDFEKRRDGEENYTTAEDMAFLLGKLYNRAFLNKNVSEKCLLILGNQKINDRIPRKLPKNGTFIAHKTGLERRICHDVGIVFTQKGNFMICVLIKHNDKLARHAKKIISDISLNVYQYCQEF